MEAPLGRTSTDALGGCERLAATPIPFTYGVIIHRTIYLYCLLLPFGLVDSIGRMTPVIVAFVAYTFLALEALGSAELEEPFGTRAQRPRRSTRMCWPPSRPPLRESDGRNPAAAALPGAGRVHADLKSRIRAPSHPRPPGPAGCPSTEARW
jgi:hypothetical protein